MIVNLLRNALKFSVGGTVRLIVAYDADQERIRAHVQDDGLGICEADLNKIFELDVRARSGTSLNKDGLGMGLAICRGIVLRLGGSIRVCSEGLRKGSTFTFSVEMKQPPVSALEVSFNDDDSGLEASERRSADPDLATFGQPSKMIDGSSSHTRKDPTELEREVLQAIADDDSSDNAI